MDLTKKSEKFVRSVDCGRAFDKLRKVFTSGLILRYFNPELPLTFECNATDFAIGAIL